jgi:hypothetical protein|tara:strand:- start:458 stop:958 length:501 start_codon:yes stop_codon:yes gene_type:complete
MSLPRRAMEQMGFSICCLSCDAPDVAGLARCKSCMDGHAKFRERLTIGKATTKAQRLAREFVTMLADPEGYIDDDDHGKWMARYSSMISDHEHDPESTQSRTTVSRARVSRKTSIIREVANQNKWVDKPPEESEMDELLAAFGGRDEEGPMTWDDLLSEIEEMLED